MYFHASGSSHWLQKHKRHHAPPIPPADIQNGVFVKQSTAIAKLWSSSCAKPQVTLDR